MLAAELKLRPKAEETALPASFCLEILFRENIMTPCLRSYFVTKRLAAGNLCHEAVGNRR